MVSCGKTEFAITLAALSGFIVGFMYSDTYIRFSMNVAKTSSKPGMGHSETGNAKANNTFKDGKSEKVQVTSKLGIHTSNNPTQFINKEFLGTVIARNDSGWHIEKHYCDGTGTFIRAHLRGPQYTPIFVYSAQEDQWVSGNIIRQGMWEGSLVTRVHGILASVPDVVFLDIGANVGVFALTAAKLGRRVVAVDALAGNVARLCKSVKEGGLGDRMTIIHNALSYHRERVELGTYAGNVGGTYVKKLGIKPVNTALVVDAILLDDLLEIINFKRVVIKMDVETFEANVLKGAETFFNKVQVDFLLMEFASHRGQESGTFIIEYLKKHKLEPEIKTTDHSKWPGEVMFIRMS